MPKPSLIALIVIGLGSVSLCDAQEFGFIRIFDGKTLNGWSAPDMSYWSVEEGAITGRATREHPNPKSRWLVWQGGEVGDFELKLKFRIYGTVEANSGVQFRTVFSSENTHASGYQADLVRDPVWMGLIYDEGTVSSCEILDSVANLREYDWNFSKLWYSAAMEGRRETVLKVK